MEGCTIHLSFVCQKEGMMEDMPSNGCVSIFDDTLPCVVVYIKLWPILSLKE